MNLFREAPSGRMGGILQVDLTGFVGPYLPSVFDVPMLGAILLPYPLHWDRIVSESFEAVSKEPFITLPVFVLPCRRRT